MVKMKRIGIVAVGALCASVVFGEAAADETVKKPEVLKVLMIGNSFSEQMVPSMPPIAKNLGLKVDVCSMFIGGCTLERHWKNICAPTSTPYKVTRAATDGVKRKAFKGNIPAVLTSEKWDIVTIQQGSHLSWKAQSYHPWGDNLVKYVREKAPQAKIVVHETWSYTPWDGRFAQWKIDQNEMYSKLHDAYGAFAKQHGLEVIPFGTAVRDWRRRLPVRYAENSFGGDVVGGGKQDERDHFKRDASGKWVPNCDVFHLGRKGEYFQALVWAKTLFGVDLKDLKYKPSFVSDSDAKLMREIAMDRK